MECSYLEDERLENEERVATGGLWMTHTEGFCLLAFWPAVLI